MRDISYFGQTKDLPGNQYVGYSVNNPVDAQNYANFVSQTIPSSRVQYGVRKMVRWLVPERGVVEMYINPQNIRIHQQKLIKSERSKGGFIIQYWGEDLIAISINGHTGSSGIEGINVLNDVYRGEQIAFDAVALEALAKSKSEDENFLTAAIPGLGQVLDFAKNLGEQQQGTGLTIPKPTLGFYASTIEMYWMGEVYRGFFENFDVTESADKLGIFDYAISFKATQKRGLRRNYLPWQHTAVSGPSDHNTIPFTFGSTIFNAFNVDQDMAENLAKQEAQSLAVGVTSGG